MKSDQRLDRKSGRETRLWRKRHDRTPFPPLAAADQAALAAAPPLAPAIIGRATAATMKMRLSSSQANDPKYANGRVYYDNLTKQLKANGLGEQVEVAFFPDNQLGQEIDVINSVKLGVIDMMVSGSSISANLVPLVGTFDLGYLFDPASRSRPRRSTPAPPSRSRRRC